MAMVCLTLINIVLYFFQPYLATALLYVVVMYKLTINKGSIVEKLIDAIVYATPFYYYSLWGRIQRFSLCITLTILLCLYLTIATFRKKGGKIKKSELFIFLGAILSIVPYILSMLSSSDSAQAILDTYQLIVIIWLVVVGRMAASWGMFDKIDTIKWMNQYCHGIVAVGISVYIQAFLYRIAGMQVGFVFVWGNGFRVIYNSIYVAKSVLSLYLAIGMLFLFIRLFEKVTFLGILQIVLLGGAILLNNSRTGLACFIAVAGWYALRNIRKLVRRFGLLIGAIVGTVAVVYVIQSMLASRTGLANFTDDNGRMDLLIKSMAYMKNTIFVGIGGALTDYTRIGMETSTHNFAIQYMIQFGVIAGIVLDYILCIPLFSTHDEWKYYVLIVLIGGMMFTHLQNALYIIPVFMFAILESRKRKQNITKGGIADER